MFSVIIATMSKNHTTNPEIPPLFETLLLQYLSQQAHITEYELMKLLVDEGFEQFKPSLEPIEMFQSHFLLFHLLYRLQDQWRMKNMGQLNIHTLCIELVELTPNNPEKVPSLVRKDSLRDYYLDFNAFLETQTEDVIALMDSFWKGFTTHAIASKQLAEAKQTLEIDAECFDAQKVRHQYRKLSQRHHPDKGGCNEKFLQLGNARETLLKHLHWRG